jgi:predicted DNA-binding protein (UPF0251 family)
MHTLRHTCATLALTADPPVPLHVVAARMGDEPQTALRFYAHVMPHSDAIAADTVGALLAPNPSIPEQDPPPADDALTPHNPHRAPRADVAGRAAARRDLDAGARAMWPKPRPPRQTDPLWATALGPRELEALRLIEARPGTTIKELRVALGITRGRVWQIVHQLERPATYRSDLPRNESGKAVPRSLPASATDSTPS